MSDAEEQLDGQAGDGESPSTCDLPSEALHPGSQIGQFRIERELGHGGSGFVYLATDTKLDREVAIKSTPPGSFDDATLRSRFQREAKLLASLNHPNIATIHEELEETRGQTYLVLEYVPGETLGQRIAKGPYELKEALGIAVEITEAMAAAHQKGVVHRDLKPENIKITPEGRTKILDFGIAKMVSAGRPRAATITEPGQVIGTPGYMSPEQARGEPTDHRTDIWSFGCLLYEMLTGKCAFPGQTASEALASILKADPDWNALPVPQLRDILGRCLRKEPEQRYRSADELLEALRNCQEALTVPRVKVVDLKALRRSMHRPTVAAFAALCIVVACLIVYAVIRHNMNARRAMGEIPEIIRLIDDGEYRVAFQLAKKVERYLPDESILEPLWQDMSCEYTIVTTPPGADILYKEYSGVDSQWLYLGRSPQERVRIPIGLYRLRATKDGYETRDSVLRYEDPHSRRLAITLLEKGRHPGMLLVQAPPDPALGEPELEYLMDRYEVTNEQYQKFVDAGGYTDEKYWEHRFVKEGRELTWKEAVNGFRDKTNRRGPATWEAGTFPEGQERYPVSGISWYEAAAYAEFAGKELPTVDLWERAAGGFFMFSGVEGFGNFGDGPAPVGSYQGVGVHGLYDMGGNVREWCWNATDDTGNLRYILGGSWVDPDYMFALHDIRSPWDRDQGNGFRCVQYSAGRQSIPSDYFDPEPKPSVRDFSSMAPLSSEDFSDFCERCAYDPRPLNPAVELSDDSPRHWRKMKITFDAADGERVAAYLFLPKRVDAPYQPVVVFPHIGSLWRDFADSFVPAFVVKSGRAVLCPVYKGTFDRRFDEGPPLSEPYAFCDWHVQMVKDLSRAIDYLKTREDIDLGKLAYYGISSGAMEGPLMLAMEDRIRVAVLEDGGFPGGSSGQDILDIAKFAGHVDVPVLMVNGKYDSVFPYQTSQLPLYEVLKERNDDTDHKVYAGPHGIRRYFSADIERYVIGWLDRHRDEAD